MDTGELTLFTCKHERSGERRRQKGPSLALELDRYLLKQLRVLITYDYISSIKDIAFCNYRKFVHERNRARYITVLYRALRASATACHLNLSYPQPRLRDHQIKTANADVNNSRGGAIQWYHYGRTIEIANSNELYSVTLKKKSN